MYDLRAWAYMGKYYADKIRGSVYFHAFKAGLGVENRKKSIQVLEEALEMWKKYAAVASRNYKPQFMAKTRTIDWEKLTKKVQEDIEIVNNN